MKTDAFRCAILELTELVTAFQQGRKGHLIDPHQKKKSSSLIMTRTEGGHSTDRDYFKLQFHAHNLELGFISTTMVCKHKCPRNSL